jgi:hypothetical protein
MTPPSTSFYRGGMRAIVDAATTLPSQHTGNDGLAMIKALRIVSLSGREHDLRFNQKRSRGRRQ